MQLLVKPMSFVPSSTTDGNLLFDVENKYQKNISITTKVVCLFPSYVIKA